MKIITAATKDTWLSGDYTGDNRPMMRATIQAMAGRNCPQPSGDEVYFTHIFGQTAFPRELPNIKSVKWNRSVDNDVATCEIVLWNTVKMPLGATPERDAELDYPGYYTYNRGATSWSTSRWGHTTNSWQDMLVPDRVVRTYEGYGFDASVSPDKDPHMYPSGVWLIDDVEYTHDGLITLTMRDVGRGLLEQIMFPPVVPFKKYPLFFDRFFTVDNPDIVQTTGGTTWVHPAYSTDSGVPYVGLGGSVFGHHGSDAFDGSTGSPNLSSYWLSIGNGHPSAPYAFEYIEGKIGSNSLSAIKFTTWGGPYQCYISIKTGTGGWLGRAVIPYDPANPVSAPNGANITYIASFTVGKDATYTWRPPTHVANVTAVRLTFTNLYNSGIGTYPYRAGVRNFQLAIGTSTTRTIDGGFHWDGNYGDYTDIVKRLCAYGGFYWPNDSQISYINNADGTTDVFVPAVPNDSQTYSSGSSSHPYRPIETGRIWGDFENTFTSGIASLGVEIWDKKPLMDGINYVKDIIGFMFFIDEWGCVIWRSPNIWSVGNTLTHDTVFHESADEILTRIASDVLAHRRTWNDVRRSVDALVPRTQVYPPNGYPDDASQTTITAAKAYVALIYSNRGVDINAYPTRTTDVHVIDEDQVLIGLRAKLSSRNVRERIVVANVNGKIGASFPAQGKPALNPYPSNSRRVAGWTDQNFATNDECQVMADMIAIRELFTYRTDTLTIAGNPAIQIDDQVRIFERVTNEGYIHYVRSIESTWDAETGKWTYNLETHWLGETPFSNWVFDPAQMSAATVAYLTALGKV